MPNSGEAARGHLLESPVILASDLTNHIAIFQFGRQHFPGVSLHFDVGTEFGIFLEDVHYAEEMIHSGVEEFRRAAMERHMEMNAPFLLALRAGNRGWLESFVEIEIPGEQ